MISPALVLAAGSSRASFPWTHTWNIVAQNFITNANEILWIHRWCLLLNWVYLWKHLFIWYRLCLNASGMLSAMLSVLLKLGLDAILAWKQRRWTGMLWRKDAVKLWLAGHWWAAIYRREHKTLVSWQGFLFVDASWKWKMARRGESTLICLGKVMLKKHTRQERHGHQRRIIARFLGLILYHTFFKVTSN